MLCDGQALEVTQRNYVSFEIRVGNAACDCELAALSNGVILSRAAAAPLTSIARTRRWTEAAKLAVIESPLPVYIFINFWF